MAKDFQQITRDITQGIVEIRRTRPQVMEGFNKLSSAAMEDGALDKKSKELIALAIGVATHCDGCIGFHTGALARLGASREEVMDALAVSVYMGGGPSLMYASEAIQAFDQFAAKDD